MGLDIYNDSYDHFCHAISLENAKILEIGFGPGNITKYLISKRPDFEISGIDIAPNMVELARKNNPAASFSIMDCRNIDQIKTKYEGIICGFCLPYLSHAEGQKLIADCNNLLKANGMVHISFVEGDPDKSGFQVGSTGDRTYFYYYNLEDLKSILIDSKFVEIKIFKVEFKKTENQADIHTIVTARKNPFA